MEKKTRLQFHEELKEVLGSGNVYFSPPESIKLQYPCIVYTRASADMTKANNKTYSFVPRYTVTIIDKDPDSGEFKSKQDAYEEVDAHTESIIERMAYRFEMCRYDRHYTDNNLNYDVFDIYY